MTQFSADPRKIDAICRYLQERFPENEIDHFPRGHTAHLFVVMKRTKDIDPTKTRVLHQLLITRRYLDRFTDHASLVDGLSAADVVVQMTRSRDRTVELY